MVEFYFRKYSENFLKEYVKFAKMEIRINLRNSKNYLKNLLNILNMRLIEK
jgi:hypothetical protein